MKKVEIMSKPIEEYFTNVEGNKDYLVSKELFQAEDTNVDVKTDLTFREITLINSMKYLNTLLVNKKLKPVYENHLKPYLRLKISLDRKSRGEYVNVNKGDRTDDLIGNLSNLKNISEDKK